MRCQQKLVLIPRECDEYFYKRLHGMSERDQSDTEVRYFAPTVYIGRYNVAYASCSQKKKG